MSTQKYHHNVLVMLRWNPISMTNTGLHMDLLMNSYLVSYW